MTEERGRESDQLPEEAPDEQIVEDTGGGEAREEARRNPGGAGEEGRATGHPDESRERETRKERNG